MEFAMRQALEQNKDEEALAPPSAPSRSRSSKAKDELEEILSKTLEHEVQAG
jgi:hypothetical protein